MHLSIRFLLGLCVAATCTPVHAGGVIVLQPWTVGGDPFCAYSTINAALVAAAAAPGAQTIRIARNRSYTAQQLAINDPAAVTLQGGYSVCSQQTPSGDPTVLTGSAAAAVVDILGNGNVTLDRLVIEGGGGTVAGNPSLKRGGGVLHRGGGVLTVHGSIVRNNTAARGSGVAVIGEGSLTLADSTVMGNSSNSGDGDPARAAIHAVGGKLARVELRDCTLADNVPGGLFVAGLSAVAIERCTASGHGPSAALQFATAAPVNVRTSVLRANPGGGLRHVGGTQGLGSLYLANGVMEENCGVAAIAIEGSVEATVEATTISENCASGIRVADNASLQLRDSIVQHNSSQTGGGLLLPTDGTVEVRDSQILSNSAVQHGGGIDWSGAGSLELVATTVADNLAIEGAGIAARAPPALEQRPLLRIGVDTVISGNTASGNGGGILAHDIELDVSDAPRHRIAGNLAANGGGLALTGDTFARVASGDMDGNIVDNRATGNGGGVWIVAPAQATLYTSDGDAPVALLRNRADAINGYGGGVAMDGAAGVEPARLFVFDARIENNVAFYGGGVAALGLDESPLVVCVARSLGDPCADLGGALPIGVQACRDPTQCNTLRGNEATGPYGGAAILRVVNAIGEGRMRLAGLRIEGNSGRSLMLTSASVQTLVAPQLPLEVFDSVLAGNVASNALFDGLPAGLANVPEDFQHSLGPVAIERSSVANNVIGAPYVFGSRIGLRLIESIVHQPGVLVHAGNASGVEARHVIANELQTLPVRVDVVSADPGLVDADANDLRLQPDSPAVDFSDFGSGGVDILGVARGQDMPDVIDRFGPRDLGAHELGLSGVFRDSFEGLPPP